MYKVKIFSTGKTREPWLKQAIEEYTRRLSPILSIQWIFVKTDLQLEKALAAERYVALAPAGKSYTSPAFSSFLLGILANERARLAFAIGGAEGLSPFLIKNALSTLSLSTMTFTHQMTRLVFLEQLYRAFEIEKGSNYHK